MARFEWIPFLENLGISYVREGPNVSRGNVNIQCPFCGDSDPSEHMGLRLSDAAWGCFRDPTHRGKNPTKLVAALKGCSFIEAKGLVEGKETPGTQSVAWLKQQLLGLDQEEPDLPTIEYPKEFRPFKGEGGWVEKRFLYYLRDRGFHRPLALSKSYDLRFAVTGEFNQRLIFPLHRGMNLVGWTGRAVSPSSVRYKTHPAGKGVRNLIFNELLAFREPRKNLVVVEGPVDALKLDFYGEKAGVRAVALLGLTLGAGKLERLGDFRKIYDRIILLLDSEALSQNLRMEKELAVLGVEFRPGVLGSYKDPGEIPPDDLPGIFKKLLVH